MSAPNPATPAWQAPFRFVNALIDKAYEPTVLPRVKGALLLFSAGWLLGLTLGAAVAVVEAVATASSTPVHFDVKAK